MIFIHSLGQPLIVRSHSKVHRSRGNPKEIPTWASRVSNYSYFPWFNRQQTCVQWQVRRCRRRRNCIYYIKYFRKAAGILLLGVWCKNIRYNIPIITLVGVWLEGRQTVGSHSNKGDNCLISHNVASPERNSNLFRKQFKKDMEIQKYLTASINSWQQLYSILIYKWL